jgi:membrane-bound serine protease (ClpP class)
MKKYYLLLSVILIMSFSFLSVSAQSPVYLDVPETPPDDDQPLRIDKSNNVVETLRVFIIPIQGDIELSTAVFVQSRVDQALEAGADLLIFPIDTFGGRVDAALRIAASIGSVSSAQTIAYVGAGSDSLGVSWSAGALIALSTTRIFMAPGTSLGAAAPVFASADGSATAAGEKTVSAVRAQMASLAEKNGHPPGIALAMVDTDVELIEVRINGEISAVTTQELTRLEQDGVEIIRGPVISEPGKLLSLTAGEAERFGLSSGTYRTLDALMESLGNQTGRVVISETLVPTTADRLMVLLTSAGFQSLLILAGLVALFLEINSPGFGIPGTIALVAFSILFGTNALMGTLGSLEVLLFLLGAGLLLIEIFILPGFGVAGISGIALIAGSLIFSMQTFVLPDYDWEWEVFMQNAGTVGAGIGLGIIVIGLLVAFGPKLKIFDRITLRTSISGTASGQEVDQEQIPLNPDVFPGQKGRSLTVLRPVGTGVFGTTTLSVEAESGYVEAGVELEITKLKGGVVYVRTLS